MKHKLKMALGFICFKVLMLFEKAPTGRVGGFILPWAGYYAFDEETK